MYITKIILTILQCVIFNSAKVMMMSTGQGYSHNTFHFKDKEVVKKRSFHGHPPPVSFWLFFLGVRLTLNYENMCSGADFNQEKGKEIDPRRLSKLW